MSMRVRTCVCVCLYACMYAYMYVYVRLCAHACALCVCAHVCKCALCLRTCMHRDVHVLIHIHTQEVCPIISKQAAATARGKRVELLKENEGNCGSG